MTGFDDLDDAAKVRYSQAELAATFAELSAVLDRLAAMRTNAGDPDGDVRFTLGPDGRLLSLFLDESVPARFTHLALEEDYRDRLVVIVAGYPKEMRRFLKANPGLASRFHVTLTFSSYSPAEIVQIGRHIAQKEKIAIADTAWPLLEAEATRLRSTPIEQGTALDTAGNGRFARKVVIHCKHERARRLSTTPPHLLAAASNDDLIVNDDDMRRAIAAALATQ